jgi:hypothetical protein
MTISAKPMDLTGNHCIIDGAGTGAPTFSAKKGTVYINLTGSSTSTRMYVNTDGATTWTNFTTAA